MSDLPETWVDVFFALKTEDSSPRGIVGIELLLSILRVHCLRWALFELFHEVPKANRRIGLYLEPGFLTFRFFVAEA